MTEEYFISNLSFTDNEIIIDRLLSLSEMSKQSDILAHKYISISLEAINSAYSTNYKISLENGLVASIREAIIKFLRTIMDSINYVIKIIKDTLKDIFGISSENTKIIKRLIIAEDDDGEDEVIKEIPVIYNSSLYNYIYMGENEWYSNVQDVYYYALNVKDFLVKLLILANNIILSKDNNKHINKLIVAIQAENDLDIISKDNITSDMEEIRLAINEFIKLNRTPFLQFARKDNYYGPKFSDICIQIKTLDGSNYSNFIKIGPIGKNADTNNKNKPIRPLDKAQRKSILSLADKGLNTDDLQTKDFDNTLSILKKKLSIVTDYISAMKDMGDDAFLEKFNLLAKCLGYQTSIINILNVAITKFIVSIEGNNDSSCKKIVGLKKALICYVQLSKKAFKENKSKS
jgi:hypothetical protein